MRIGTAGRAGQRECSDTSNYDRRRFCLAAPCHAAHRLDRNFPDDAWYG